MRATRGTTCPRCGRYASVTRGGCLYRHRGSTPKLIGPGFEICRASGKDLDQVTVSITSEMRARRDRSVAMFGDQFRENGGRS